MASQFFRAAVKRLSPPWLLRQRWSAVMQAIAAELDLLVDRAADGVRARFPGKAPSDAIALIGGDRKIIRGPGETDETYASRLRIWWDSHRTRGGAFALLAQLHAYWLASLNVPIEVVAHSGGRQSMAIDGSIVVDAITWGADGTTSWAKDWIFFHTPAFLTIALVDEGGNVIVDEEGNVVTGELSLSAVALAGGTLPANLVESFSLVPRTWRPAHLKRCTIVLLYGIGRLWDYPVPVPTWDAWETALAGATWDDVDAEAPIQIVLEH